MHLAPRDIDKLLLHSAGTLAQQRLARGVRLNLPESTALIATVLLEWIRDGLSVATLMDRGKRLLGRSQVMQGVGDLLAEVQVEGTFPDGTKLVTVHHPICAEHGDLSLALYGSFFPVPPQSLFETPRALSDILPPNEAGDVPGAVLVPEGEIELNANRESIELEIVHHGDRPVQVGSHYPFHETNSALRFDRESARGFRLDIPAGTAVRFEPGETRSVRLVRVGEAP